MRVTITAKGELEAYIKQEMEKTGLSAGMVGLILAQAGLEYKQGLKSFATLAAALEGQEQSRKQETLEE